MLRWLRDTTWFQRIALLFLIGSIVTLRTEPITLALLLAFFAFRRQLLWRVRNRLLITYILFGVVPIFLIVWLLGLTGTLLLGAFASDRVRSELDARIERIHALTQDLAVAASHGAPSAQLQKMLDREPRLVAIVFEKGAPVISPAAPAPIKSAPDWLAPGFKGLFESNGNYYLGARVRDASANEAFTYLPFDDQTLATLTPGMVAVTQVIGGSVNTNIGFSPAGSTMSIQQGGVKHPVTTSALPPRKHSWDISIATLLNWEAATASGHDDILMPILSRPSLLLGGVVTGRMASVVVSVLIIVGIFFLLVEIVSLISSARLTRTITRSVHDLYQGTLLVSSGDFSHQIPVRGRHQLSDLATSFNSMTTQINHYLGEMRKKEKLESELEVARQVQSRLFPRVVPEVRTLEMAGLCLPGRVVSGDYYDFVHLDNRFTAIALGDVSGKGVSAALLMASIQSSLHAQLKFSGGALTPSLSTATLMGLISQQLYESTPAEKYATFFCSVYDDEQGVLRYTNCGHLKPILIRAGEVSTLDGDGMVVGLLPNTTYEQMEFQLKSGDLLAIFSDGIPKAENVKEEEFGEPRLGELLGKHASEPLEKIIQIVTESVHAWIHDPEGQDDTTLVLLRKR